MDLSIITNNLNTIFVVLFYFTIILLVYLNRKKFEIQSGFIALKRTKIGLKIIKSIGTKHRELIKILGYIGIGIGFIGMFFVSYLLIDNLFKLITIPGTQSQIAPALPGIKIPGSPIYIPLIIGWLALFIVVLVHEFSHGIVATANGIKVKSSGIVFFGPIMGAFVEPDEKALVKKPDVVQYSVFAAGPFSNVLLSIAAFLIVLLVISPLLGALTNPVGFSFDDVSKGLPAAKAGIKPGMVFIRVNGNEVNSSSFFINLMENSLPNEIIILETQTQRFELTTGQNPVNNSKGYAGISGIRTEFKVKPNLNGLWFLYPILSHFGELLFWVYFLSLGIGIINLLPLGPIDGGRILQVSLLKIKGKKKGLSLWTKLSFFFLLLLLLNIFLPLVLSTLRKIF